MHHKFECKNVPADIEVEIYGNGEKAVFEILATGKGFDEPHPLSFSVTGAAEFCALAEALMIVAQEIGNKHVQRVDKNDRDKLAEEMS